MSIAQKGNGSQLAVAVQCTDPYSMANSWQAKNCSSATSSKESALLKVKSDLLHTIDLFQMNKIGNWHCNRHINCDHWGPNTKFSKKCFEECITKNICHILKLQNASI